MNLKSLFLIVSCVAFSNIHCSYKDQQATKESLPVSSSSDAPQKAKVTSFLTPQQEGACEHEKATEAAQPTP